MTKRNTTATFDIPQILIDVVTLVVAFFIAAAITNAINRVLDLSYHLWLLAVFAVIFVLIMLLGRMYNLTTFYYTDRIILRTVFATVASGACATLVIFLAKLTSTSRLMFGLFCGLSLIFVAAQRIALRQVRRAGLTKKAKRAIFIGTNDVFGRYSHYLDQTAMRYEFVNTLPYTAPCLSQTRLFEEYLMGESLDEVAIEYRESSGFDYGAFMKICEDMGITTRLIWNMEGMGLSDKFVSSIGTFPVVTYHSVSMDQVQIFCKGVIDFVAALVGILLLLPLFIAVTLAIKLSSPGPALFKQKRVGTNGKVFQIYKFRSMCVDADEKKSSLLAQNKIKDGMMFKMDNDPRVTKVGAFLRKTSIDELPQLFNVLRGDMSLVGTRPPTLDELQKYTRRQRRRLSIKPGITGMWQVSGRSDIVDFDQVVALDQSYIDNWSLLLDIKLLFKTLGIVLNRSGAC